MCEKIREDMVRDQIEGRGIENKRVIEAMRSVPRHLFVREMDVHKAYWDCPLPIGRGQTISQPYIVAYMIEALRLTGEERVLEIGAGSGYEAAILSILAREVISMEIVPELAREVAVRLRDLGYSNVEIVEGNGYRGHEEGAPYDAIILSAAPESIPEALIDQLAPGGRMILPLGGYFQKLVVIERGPGDKVYMRELLPVRFVPMVGD